MDSDLRVLERAATDGDATARVRFFAAALRGDDAEAALLAKIDERVYAAAMFALAAVETGVDPESSRFYSGGVIESTLAVTEDDCVRVLARCVRRLTGSATWDVVLLKELQIGAWPVIAGALAGKSADGQVALAIRSKTLVNWFEPWIRKSIRVAPVVDHSCVSYMTATLEAMSQVFGIHVLPNEDDIRAARRAMRQARGGPLVRPRVPPPSQSIAIWADYAPERNGKSAWIDQPGTMSPTYANGTRPIVLAPESVVRRWASLWP